MAKSKSSSKKTSYGIFYRSNGRWAGPYGGLTFTKKAINTNVMKEQLRNLSNYVLKSKVKVMPL